MAEARRAGIPACVYVSTASVYGRGPHRGITENSVAPSPQSPVSSSRLAAETLIRAAGGTVVHPHLVYPRADHRPPMPARRYAVISKSHCRRPP
ncbi:NAD-dependent epimerase/dehydratase family protein [Micromonospora sp. NBC_01405]|uniref:NAD-dependent epimerase/dehydratase family protein n=1 Tax=Micromonospora sp. NBC_01405 TaxID=2903589 RepID=UPI00386A3041